MGGINLFLFFFLHFLIKLSEKRQTKKGLSRPSIWSVSLSNSNLLLDFGLSPDIFYYKFIPQNVKGFQRKLLLFILFNYL